MEKDITDYNEVISRIDAQHASGNLNLEHLEWFSSLSNAQRSELHEEGTLFEFDQEFTLQIPENWNPIHAIEKFHEKFTKEKWRYDQEGVGRFAIMTNLLTPDSSITCKFWEQKPATTTLQDRIRFCEKLPGNQFLGFQVMPLVFGSIIDVLALGAEYTFIEPDTIFPSRDNHTDNQEVVSNLMIGINGKNEVAVKESGEAFYSHHPLVTFHIEQ